MTREIMAIFLRQEKKIKKKKYLGGERGEGGEGL